jgi:hypothetical protein
MERDDQRRDLCTAIPNPVFMAIEIADIRFS